MSTEPRILGVRLLSAVPLPDLERFYGVVLGLPIEPAAPGELRVRAGRSRLTFVAGEADGDDPFYHFAFNIPENKASGARDWQRSRTPLICPDDDDLHDRAPGHPDGIVHFPHWNAHAIFFWDPAGNLVEYIARHDLANGGAGAFESRDLLCLSEVALVVDDVPSAADHLTASLGWPRYGEASDRFTALGDERGLLLVMRRGRRLGFDSGKPASIHPTVVTVAGAGPARFSIPGQPHEIRVERSRRVPEG